MDDDALPGIVISDLYAVPRAIDVAGNQVRPRFGAPRDGYSCPVCATPVIQVVSGSGNPFFRHVHSDDSCRSEPLVHLAAREILSTLIEHARLGRIQLNVRVPCVSCGAGHEIDFPLGDATEVSDQLWLEPQIKENIEADLSCTKRGDPISSIVVQSESALCPDERQLLTEPWIEVSAASIKSSNTVRKGIYQQRDVVPIRAVSSSFEITCETCRVKEEKIKEREKEEREQRSRDQVKLDQHAHTLATRLSRLASWWIVVPTPCPTCKHPMAVGVSKKFFDRAEPLVHDHEGHAWHVGLMRDGKVALGVVIVQATAFDGTTQLGGTVPYAVVPLLDDPFEARDGVLTLITKHVRFMRDPKLVCIHCAQVERLAEEQRARAEAKRVADQAAKQRAEAAQRERAEAKRIADQEAKRRADALRVAELARQREQAERDRIAQLAEQAAKKEAEEERQRQEAETKRRREAQQAREREEANAREAARIARELHLRSPRGQLELLVQEVTASIVDHDRPTFLRTYRQQRRRIAELRLADPTATDLATEAQARLDRMAKAEWASVQKRERRQIELAEAAKVRASMEGAWKTLIEQLTRWRDDKDWTIPEEMAIDACDRFFRANPLFLPPAEWGRLISGRKRHARAPEVRAEVLPPR